MLSLILAALFFAGIHLGIAGTAVRDRAIQILSEKALQAEQTKPARYITAVQLRTPMLVVVALRRLHTRPLPDPADGDNCKWQSE